MTSREELLRNIQGAVHLLRKAIHAGDPRTELDFRCHDIWTDLEKAIPAPAQSSWQPIETAPKDGVAVLLGFWHQGRFAQYYGFSSPGGWMENSRAFFPKHMQGWFTHWQPLPAPPPSASTPIGQASIPTPRQQWPRKEDRPMTDHTRTPWSYRIASDVEGGIIIGGENSNAALVPGYNDHPHNIANAAFICKAVNSHDALVSALEKIAAMDPKGIRADDLGRAARIAREALGAYAATDGRGANFGTRKEAVAWLITQYERRGERQ